MDPTVRIRHENREMIRIAKLCFFDLFNEHSLSRPRTLSYNTLYFTISFSTPLPPFHLPLPPSTLSSPSSHPLLPPSTPPHYPSLPSFYSCGSGGIGSFPLTLPNPLLTLPNPLLPSSTLLLHRWFRRGRIWWGLWRSSSANRTNIQRSYADRSIGGKWGLYTGRHPLHREFFRAD